MTLTLNSPCLALLAAPGYHEGVARLLLGEHLVSANIISREQLAEVLNTPRTDDLRIGEILVARGWVSEAKLIQALSLQLSIPWVSLYHIDFSRQLLNLVPHETAERHCLVPVFVRHVKGHGDTLYVAMDDPTDEDALREVAAAARLPTRPMLASATDIRSAIRVYYAGERSELPPVVAPTTNPGVAPQAPPPSRVAAPKPPVPVSASAPSTHPPVQPVAAAAPPAPASSPKGIDDPPPSGPAPIPPPPADAPLTAARSAEGGPRRRASRPRMVALTFLDGTTIQLPGLGDTPTPNAVAPAPAEAPVPDTMTARDVIAALRAVAQGGEATQALGGKPQWEIIVAALLAAMLKKGVIADWEFVEELRKLQR